MYPQDVPRESAPYIVRQVYRHGWTQTAGPTDRWTHGPLDPRTAGPMHCDDSTQAQPNTCSHSFTHPSIHSLYTPHLSVVGESPGVHSSKLPTQSCQLSHSRADSSRLSHSRAYSSHRSQSCLLQPSVSRADSSRWSQSCRLQPSATVVPTPAVGHSRAYSSRRSQSCRLQPSVTVVQTPAVGHSHADFKYQTARVSLGSHQRSKF